MPPAGLRVRSGGGPGAPVVVGPADAPQAEVDAALAALAHLVAAGGPLAAGADVDLGNGFRSGRLDGGRGDRRDALLAALSTDQSRLGPREAVVTALFGPRATRRVGAAAAAALAEGRRDAVTFAAAASDVLGPEQLEPLLRLPDAGTFGPGLASDAAAHLRRLLDGLPGPRRLTLLEDLWHTVAEERAAARRAADLRRAQDGGDIGELRDRYRKLDDESTLEASGIWPGTPPPLAQALRMTLPDEAWQSGATRLFVDALAATTLGRLAETAVADGLPAALARHGNALRHVAGLTHATALKRARKQVPGLSPLPARPVVWVDDVVRLARGELTRKQELAITRLTARARDWGVVLIAEIGAFWRAVDHSTEARQALRAWGAGPLADWRAVAGYSSPDRLAGWGQRVTGLDPLGERLRADESRPAAEQERLDDFFWVGELGDRTARLYGHRAADVDFLDVVPEPVTEPDPDEGQPLRPPLTSVTAALAGAAQLAELGGTVPAKPQSWAALVDGLYGTASVAEVLTGRFPVPEVLLAADGTMVPGTGLRVQVATTGRDLAEWAAYMGNCIAGAFYLEAADEATSVLLALRGADGRIVLNVELVRRYAGWRVDELRARFNADPDPEQAARVREWVAGLGVPRRPVPEAPEPALGGDRPIRTSRRSASADRLRADAGPQLRVRLAGLRAPELVRLAHALPDPPHTRTVDAVTALRRATDDELTEAVRRALAGGQELREIWHGTAARPMAAALDGLSPRLAPLARDVRLTGALRPIARIPEVGAARTVDLAALRVRAALGRLIAEEDPELARRLAARPDVPMLCAMALAATALGVGVEVRPEPRLVTRGAWIEARVAAAELAGSPPARGRLRVPGNWIPRGWPALWAKASKVGGPA